MKQIIAIEFRKVKRTFLTLLFPLVSLAPFVLVLLSRSSNQQSSLAEIVAQNSVFIQMISFTLVVITGCYIVSREYKDNTLPYLHITQRPISRVLIGKYVLLFLQIIVSQLFTFGVLILLNSILEGFSGQIALRFLLAGLVSSLLLICITPVVVYIALLRRNFVSSSLIFLFLFMLTFPFALMDYGYIFPHLLPLILVAKLLGSSQYPGINYGMGILIVAAIFAVFFYLSLRKIEKRGD